MINNQFYEADCYIRGTNLVAKYNYKNGNKSEYTYYTQNAHGDVVNLTDADGEVVKSYTYDAFGVEKNIDETDANPFRYCGEYFDAETGTIYLRARYYNPTTGRFISRDSVMGKIDDPLSLNLYTYCHNNPIIGIDPSGHFPKWAKTVCKAIAGAAVVVAAVTPVVPLSAALASAAIGATAGAGLNVFEQVHYENKEFKDINIDDVIISGTTGGISGACAMLDVSHGGQAVINGVISASSCALKGGKADDIEKNAMFGAVTGFVGGNGAGYDYRRAGIESLHFCDSMVVKDLCKRVVPGIVKGTVVSGVLDAASSKIPTSGEIIQGVANTFDKIQDKIRDIKSSFEEVMS